MHRLIIECLGIIVFGGIGLVLVGRHRNAPLPGWMAGGIVLVGLFLLGVTVVAHPPASSKGWTWPTNPSLIPGLLSSDQEIALNAQVYPVALVPVTDTARLQQLQQLATIRSKMPHRIGFLAITVRDPKSDQTALATAARLLHRDKITLPWAVVIDPPVAWQTSTLQVYWPQDQHVEHAVGSAALTAWQHATAPVAVTSVQISSHGSQLSTTSTPKAKPHTLPTSGSAPSTRHGSPRRRS